MTALLRTATPDDLPAMLALYRHLSASDPVIDPQMVEPDFRALIGSPFVHLLVAERGDMLVASCLLLIIPNLTRGGRPFGIIENVVTHGDFRRLGLATSLLHVAQERAREARCYKLMLATGRTDEGVLRFYEQAGFVRGGKTFFEIRWLD